MGRVDFVVVIPGVKRLPQGNFDVMYCNSWIWGSYLQNSRQSKSIEHLPEHEGGVFTPQLFFQFPRDHSRSLKINMCLEHGVYTIYHHIPPYTIIYHHISSYTIIYHHMPSYTIIYHHIPSYTIIYHHIPSYTIDPSYNIIYIYIPYTIIYTIYPQMASFMGNIAVYSFRDPGQSHWGAIREALCSRKSQPLLVNDTNGNERKLIRKWSINTCIIMYYPMIILSNDNIIQW
jgi:hypothetical protein